MVNIFENIAPEIADVSNESGDKIAAVAAQHTAVDAKNDAVHEDLINDVIPNDGDDEA